ncbi:SIMPL domain-containing protein [Alteribacillus sp. JSM 102045]|uniref:SIMPL domain-containing protein n=1 Tax=Alteribacillus sp. JSM 102045 TaxID=1562101 RepID=UPI0035C0E4F4
MPSSHRDEPGYCFFIEEGIKEENIYVDGKQEFREFQVSHMINVTIDNLDETGGIIDIAIQNKANRVSNVHFSLDKKSYYYQQAFHLSLEDALTKALTIADTMKLQLDSSPIHIEEQPVPVDSYHAFSVTALPIEAGQLRITAR